MSNDNEILVKVEGVSKKFCRDLKKSLWYGMCDVASELLPTQNSKFKIQNSEDALRPGEFWANKDISFELRRGECIGLIGRNGAGKTTLLKMLNGLIKPDEGSIEMRGRVGALIALGAGFNPILTGRENIYVNGSILGLTKEEIDAKINEIIDFAEIRDFIDSPVQSYSSGMQVRLGFAVATALDPDVLILDEVLAVGDAAFRNKCYKRISALRKSAAVIFVSHQMEQVARISDQALVMGHGERLYLGNVEDGIAVYEKVNESGDTQDDSFLALDTPIAAFDYKIDNNEIHSSGKLSISLQCTSHDLVEEIIIRLNFFNGAGEIVAATDIHGSDHGISLNAGHNHWRVSITSIALKRGQYPLSISLLNPAGQFLVWSHKQQSLKVTSSRLGPAAAYQPVIDEWTASPKVHSSSEISV